MLQRQLNIRITSSNPVPEELKRTEKRSVDFINRVTTEAGETFLLHIEFQNDNDKNMLLRVAEYHALLQRRYPAEVIRHVVVYFGKRRINMQHRLPEALVYRGFDLLDIRDMDSGAFLESELPEEVVLAILGDYKGRNPETVIRLLVDRLREVCQSNNDLQKFLNQLNLFSQTRNLDELTTKIIQAMPAMLDYRENYFYKWAKEDVKEQVTKEVREEVREEVRGEITEEVTKEVISKVTQEVSEKIALEMFEAFKKRTISTIQRMLEQGMELETIAEIVEVPVDVVKDIQQGAVPDGKLRMAFFQDEK